MRRNNNNKNDGHILTPTERLFYQRMSIEGIKQIIDECWKIVKNTEEEECHKIVALQTALEANVQLCNMLKTKEQQYGSVSEKSESDFDFDFDYDYGAIVEMSIDSSR
jgi:septation ring formation regulator EzrA